MSDIAEQPHDPVDDAIKLLFNPLVDRGAERADPGDAKAGWARLEAAIVAEEAGDPR